MKKLPLLAVMLMAGCPAALQAQEMPSSAQAMSGTVLDILAKGSVTRTPDQADISVGVQTRGATAKAAMSANAAQMASLRAALKKAGIADKDIQTASININAQFRYPKDQAPELAGYQATNQLKVHFRDVDRAGAILDTLVGAGANQINGPELSISNEEAALDAARMDAVAKARARAELYAKAAGMRVARIVMISEGSLPSGSPAMPAPMMRMAVADAATQIAPGEKEVTATVAVRFLLQ